MNNKLQNGVCAALAAAALFDASTQFENLQAT